MDSCKMKLEQMVDVNFLVDNGYFKKSYLYYLTSNKLIPHYKVGRRIFFNKEQLENFISTRAVDLKL